MAGDPVPPGPAAPECTGQAADLLLERGVLGLIWLDAMLDVVRRQGRLTEWVTVGQSYASALPMLVGYEAKLAQLVDTPGERAIIPNVAIRSGEGPATKFDMQIYWLPREAEYLVVLTHESTQSILELELHQEVAKRQLAESREAELASALKKTNTELTRANRDLEEFAYVISHDLRAPLRALRITSDILEHEMGDDLAPLARENLTTIRTLSRRMAAMLSGLLEYARVGRKDDAVAIIDTGRLIQDIVLGISVPSSLEIRRRGVWPVITTLAEPLDVVLRNLIENAVKHHDTKIGRIELTARDETDMVRFDIADDGPGIDPAYHGAIFEPFRTAKEEMPAESSGIGLALVKKTTEVVGGRVVVHSDPAAGRGTTFSVFWPKSIATP